MGGLILGPMLRYVSQTEATVWVETDEPCEVEVLGERDQTFCVNGHHYAPDLPHAISSPAPRTSTRSSWTASAPGRPRTATFPQASCAP